MSRGVIAFALVTVAGIAFAEGPGTRLRTTPEVPQPMTLATPEAKDAGRSCDRLGGDRRERCREELRRAGIDHRPSGPESTGMGSGAGSGAPSGAATGGASLGAGAPR